MSFFTNAKTFKKSAIGILLFYLSLMIGVAILAHLRKSGSTGMDMMKIHHKLHEQKIADK